MENKISFRCPICKEVLFVKDSSLLCNNKHCFDIAKSGYVNLCPLKKNAGDNESLVLSRVKFLQAGYYQFLAQTIHDFFTENNCKSLLDIGCGNGYYSDYLQDSFDVYGFDISKKAISLAVKGKKPLHYFVATSTNIPLSSEAFDGAYAIFAPVFEAEVVRILRDNGFFLLVLPGKRHLFEMKEVIYSEPYLNKEPHPSFNTLTLIDTLEIEDCRTLNNEYLNYLFKMTPYSYKTANADYEHILDISSLNVTFSFTIFIYQKKSRS